MKYYHSIIDTIGNTPLVKLNKVVSQVPALVLAKVESFNPGNSIKDRIGLKMIDDAEKAGLLKPGGTIIEGTSGNTGMGLALVAIARGYRCIFTTTDKQSKEKMDILRAVGAEVIVCPTNVEADDPRSYYSVARRLSKEIPNAYYPNQYDNLSNRQAHYEGTGPEIWEQTEGKVTHLVVGTGTGGTISGTARYLKEKNPNIKVWSIDTYGSVLKKFHETGTFDESEIYPYITEGIGEDIIPANIDFSLIDHFEKVTDKDGALMAREITRREGIFVGYSAGSAVAGLIQLRHLLGPNDVVVVIFHDHGSRYIGKLYNDDWMRDRGFLELKTVKDLMRSGKPKIISVQPANKVAEAIALMKQSDIDQLPVIHNGDVVGSITESLLFNKLLDNHDVKNQTVGEVMDKPFPVVSQGTTLERLSGIINKENPAVLTRDEAGNYHIITKYDIIFAF
ncbi:MAG: pyridoxal-phosphate dependent enzyme [Bacteroidetes bacterium]|jgi:cystathionine beta-synthase|nr:pyridoxal-phosphate dependent enzyme [Bacteroidota bacterium]GDX47469.1 cystathionine beta-synthase [Bacteroidota bacterium]